MNFSHLMQNDYALEQQLVKVLNAYYAPYIQGKYYYNFRCQICGDSKKSKNKKRGYLIKKQDKNWKYFCHNCGASIPAYIWLRDNHPDFYKEYMKDVISSKKDSIISRPVVQKINKTNETEKDEVKFFIPILRGTDKIFEEAIQLCTKRLIPEDVWNKWFVAIDGKYKNRIIIPFFNAKGKIYYWQGRALKSWMIPKYKSRLGSEFNNIYNYYTVDTSKEIMILEGMIDSLFVENSIAMTGLKIYDEKIKIFTHKYFILDHDDSGRKKSRQLLEQGEYVFIWNKFIKEWKLPTKEKYDINEVIIFLNRSHKFTFEELKPYFTNSVYDTVNFII